MIRTNVTLYYNYQINASKFNNRLLDEHRWLLEMSKIM